MAGKATKKIFSAELQLMKSKGQELPDHMFYQGAGKINASGVTNEQIMDAIQNLQDLLAGANNSTITSINSPETETPEAPEPVQLSEQELLQQDFEAATALKNEIRALSRSIQETKSEIKSMQAGTKGGDKLIKASSELDEVVQATEDATNTILEATETIDELAEKIRLNADNQDDSHACEEIMECTIKVLEACNFQDITGQRITKVVNALKYVEDRINAMIDIWGEDDISDTHASVVEEVDPDKDLLNGPALGDAGIDQADIDALFD